MGGYLLRRNFTVWSAALVQGLSRLEGTGACGAVEGWGRKTEPEGRAGLPGRHWTLHLFSIWCFCYHLRALLQASAVNWTVTALKLHALCGIYAFITVLKYLIWKVQPDWKCIHMLTGNNNYIYQFCKVRILNFLNIILTIVKCKRVMKNDLEFLLPIYTAVWHWWWLPSIWKDLHYVLFIGNYLQIEIQVSHENLRKSFFGIVQI